MTNMNINTTENAKKKTQITNKEIDEMAKQFGKTLKDCEKVRVRIPVIENNHEDSFVECCLNGYPYIIKRGVTLELPKPIVELLSDAGII